MKKLFLAAAIAITICSCGNKKELEVSSQDNMTAKEMMTEETIVIAPEFQKGANLIAANDCLSCHKVNEKIVGPSYLDVAEKYTVADIDMLAATIINGGQGHWGEIPMTPHADLKADDAKEMVKYILSLKKA